MATTYTFDIVDLEVYQTAQNGHDDCIKTIHWTHTADDGTNSVTRYGSVDRAVPAAGVSSYIAFDSVTKANCKTWVFEELSETEAEQKTAMDTELSELASPALASQTPSGW